MSVHSKADSSSSLRKSQTPQHLKSKFPAVITLVTIISLVAFICHEAYQVSNALLVRVAGVSVISLASFFLVSYTIEAKQHLFVKAGLVGKDINKRGTPAGDVPIPESLGLVPATFYIIVLCLLHVAGYHNGDSHMYTVAMACVTFMTLLGLSDDVLDLRWRDKLILPLFASLPLLVNYNSKTTVIVPRFVRPLAIRIGQLFGGGAAIGASGTLVDLAYGYYIYMALLSIFCTNAINIYAGINGLEAGQVAVIAVFAALHNTLNLRPFDQAKDNVSLLRAHHLLSLDMILPLLAVTLGLLRHNWYPSRVFVGDTFCYFSGMCFAMASILGHYSLTLLLLFLPQVLNFVYSVPQLFGIVPCPRHRLPRFDKSSGKLTAIKSNMNLVNLTLWVCGPMTESQLCNVLLAFQIFCCTAGLLLRTAYLHFLS